MLDLYSISSDLETFQVVQKNCLNMPILITIATGQLRIFVVFIEIIYLCQDVRSITLV